jgi:transposase
MERLAMQVIVDIIYRLRAGQSLRALHRDTGHSRDTLRQYRRLAQEHGFLDPHQPLPEPAQVQAALAPLLRPPRPQSSSLEPYREVVAALLDQGVEMVAIHQRLVRHHDYRGSYSAVRRFVHQLRPPSPDVVVRLETPPGLQAQVDFGGAGRMKDAAGKLRSAYCFVMTLSSSRHQYVEFVCDQRMETWIGCHRRAFASFGGVPKESARGGSACGMTGDRQSQSGDAAGFFG